MLFHIYIETGSSFPIRQNMVINLPYAYIVDVYNINIKVAYWQNTETIDELNTSCPFLPTFIIYIWTTLKGEKITVTTKIIK